MAAEAPSLIQPAGLAVRIRIAIGQRMQGDGISLAVACKATGDIGSTVQIGTVA